jgi:hypothetical protein
LAACGVFRLWLSERSRDDPCFEEICDSPGAIQAFQERSRGDTIAGREVVSPLLCQAQAFALYLNPPAPAVAEQPKEPPLDSGVSPRMDEVQRTRPAASSPRFTLRATSFYPSQPGRSMALISEVGSPEGSEHWVKEGSHVGHFVIHEIRQGAIVYRDGDQLREMAVDVAAAPRSLVRDIRPGSRTASAAVEGAGIALPIPAGPNNVTLSGN